MIALWVVGMALNCAICLYDSYTMGKLQQYGFMLQAHRPGVQGLRYAGFVLGSWVALIGWVIYR